MGSGIRLSFQVDPADRRPAFVQIASSLLDQMQRGRLRPGDRLPSSRGLALELGVHRNTVLAAFRELEGQGWIFGAPGRGTFVSERIPHPGGRASGRARPRVAERTGFPIARAPAPHAFLPGVEPKGVISLARNVPDPRLFPGADLARSYRRALRRSGGALLDYGDERGHPNLREQLAASLAELRGVAANADDVLVTHGSQMALYLAARAIVPPGGVVAVEALGYSLAWEAFRSAGARVVGVPLDERGLRVDRLEALVRQGLRAVYVTPHHQYPTTVVLSADRRLQLLALARRHRIALIEDDYDHELHFHGRPVLPLASDDPAGVVVYVGSLSKVFAPGVRVGFVVAPRPLLDRMTDLRRALDRQGDPALEHALADLLEDGVLQRHARRMQRTYRARRDALVEALRAQLADVVEFQVPSGGMALWARVKRPTDVDAWSKRALRAGVQFPPARFYALDRKPRPFTRLAYARHDEATLRNAITRMRAAL